MVNPSDILNLVVDDDEYINKLLYTLLNLTLRSGINGGEITLRLEDSGPGFDYHQHIPQSSETISISGRGISLVRSWCSELIYEGRGSRAKAVYVWTN